METQQQVAGLETLKDIRSIMERSSRFVSLSGWSGVWAGVVALVAAAIAMIRFPRFMNALQQPGPVNGSVPVLWDLILFGAAVFIIAFAGAYFFTVRKVKQQGVSLWSGVSRKLLISVMIPLLAGGVFCAVFMSNGQAYYIAATCLAFYGMALVNGGKYTLGEIRYLGYCELLLGCICLFFPGYGLYFWAIGFGVLHIIYGMVMWNRYDKNKTKA